jgi:hypothetical protein
MEKGYMSQEWITFVNNKRQQNCHLVRDCMLQEWIAFVNNKHQHNYHMVGDSMLQKWIAFVNNKHWLTCDNFVLHECYMWICNPLLLLPQQTSFFNLLLR